MFRPGVTALTGAVFGQATMPFGGTGQAVPSCAIEQRAGSGLIVPLHTISRKHGTGDGPVSAPSNNEERTADPNAGAIST